MKKMNYLTKHIAIFIVLFFLGFSTGFSQKKEKRTVKSTTKIAQLSKKEEVAQQKAKAKIESYKTNFLKKLNDEHKKLTILVTYRRDIYNAHKEMWRAINRELSRYNYNYIKFLAERKFMLEEYKNKLNRKIDRGIMSSRDPSLQQ